MKSIDQARVAPWDKDITERIDPNRDPSPYCVQVEPFFPRNSLVYDLGGGIGTEALYFLEHGHSVKLFDISPKALGIAAQKAQKAEYSLETQQIDFANAQIDAPENSADIVFSRLSLHYFDIETTTALFREIYRILKEGPKEACGVAYLAFKSPNDNEEMVYLRTNAEEEEPGVYVTSDGRVRARFTAEQLREMLQEAGITNYEINEIEEDLSGIKGREIEVKSGRTKLLLNEVIIRKTAAPALT